MDEQKKKVYLISSGFKVPPDEVEKTKSYWGHKRLVLNHEAHLLNEETTDLLCSESLEVRFLEFKKAFEAEDSKYVWSLRGGYGAHQLLPFLKDVAFSKEKTYMGFSDGTSIHYYLNMHLKWPSLHSPHPNTFHKDMHGLKVVSQIESVFESLGSEFSFSDLEVLNKTNDAKIEGQIIGGNLTTLVSLLGTPYNLGAKDKVLFLEEVEEPAYKVARHLNHLKQAGFLKGVKAVIFGHMIHTDSAQEKLIYEYIKEWASYQSMPVLWGLNVGHKHKENHPLWFLKNSRIHLDEAPRLINNIKNG